MGRLQLRTPGPADEQADDVAAAAAAAALEKASTVLDLRALQVSPEERAQLVQQIRRLAEAGVPFQVKNFGLSDAVLTQIREMGNRFFSQPLEQKLRSVPGHEIGAVEGYIHKLSDPHSDEVLKSYREMFRIQAFPASHKTADHVWPDPEMRDVMQAYMAGVKTFVHFFMGLLSEGLGLPLSFMEESVGEIHLLGVLCNYPRQDRDSSGAPVPGLLPHTDYNVFTLLQQDTQPGVQFWVERQWVTMPIVRNALIVDLGELTEVLSNGRYPAPVHRVLSSATNARLSIAASVDVAPAHTVFPAPALVTPDRPARYRALSYGERIQKYAEAVGANDPDTTTKKAIFLDPAAIDRTQNLYSVGGKLFIDSHPVVAVLQP